LLFEIHTHTQKHTPKISHNRKINKKTKGKNQMSKTDLDRWARWPQSAVDVVADLVVVVVVAVVVGADAMEVDESMDGLLFGCRPNGTTTLLKKTQDGDDLD
jgi:hypothetical protein